jgi:Tfp pilus assembly protein PilO
MRLFYEGKLHEMEILLSKSEVETEKLSQELDRLDKGHGSEEEMKTKLQAKRLEVAHLRKKQAELTRLTSVATRNESQISNLRNEVTEMKHKKTDLQKQIVSERKLHSVEVQQLKKQTMQKERELYKVQRASDRNALEAERAKNMAKTRLGHLTQLKSKYKESEKKLRLQTLKRGVMSKAGFDHVMVGRRQSRKRVEGREEDVKVDSLRDFFDQKVADVARKEALAEKLAQEWEEHLELSIQREELQVIHGSSENLEALNSQIKYKEDRIRQLASKLGKRQNSSDHHSHGDETFLFDQKFKQIVGSKSSLRKLIRWIN